MGTTLATHITNREAAGGAYATAAANYVAAWIELAAYDATVSNRAIGGRALATFGEHPSVAAHPEFLHRPPAVAPGAVRARHEELLAS